MSTPYIDVTKKSFKDPTGHGVGWLSNAIAGLRKADVLVGIPQAENRTGRNQKIGNASIMYIQTHGSPVQNIPARPVIEPAIVADGNREAISEELKQYAQEMLKEFPNPQKAISDLRRAGQIAANVSKAWFTDARNHWPPNRPSTIRRKKSDRPLIDTGALRKAIVFIIREHQ